MTTTNNTINLMDIINEQETTRRTRTSNYTEYTSKKKLFASGIFTETQVETITQLKGTFSFSIHKDLQYLIITLYDRKAEDNKYSFLIVDLKTMEVQQAPSIKISKETVDEIVANNVNKEEKKEEPKATKKETKEVEQKKDSKKKDTKKETKKGTEEKTDSKKETEKEVK